MEIIADIATYAAKALVTATLFLATAKAWAAGAGRTAPPFGRN